MLHQLTVPTRKKDQVIDITQEIESILAHLQEGVCTIFVSHTTCCVTTADLDPGTDQDLLDALRKIAPRLEYRHPHNPGHAPDHILSSIIGPSVTIPVKDKKLLLGTWQRVILVELDGPRDRTVYIITS